MAEFWSSQKSEPVRKYRFTFGQAEGEAVWWWAVTAGKPSVEISTEEYTLVNHSFKYPGIARWEDVTVTVVDPKEQAAKLMKILEKQGYGAPGKTTKGTEKTGTNQFVIKQLDAGGKAIETWTLKNSFIKGINFGELDYSSDELVTIEITISYDWAEIT